jgi:hypothetical protein
MDLPCVHCGAPASDIDHLVPRWRTTVSDARPARRRLGGTAEGGDLSGVLGHERTTLVAYSILGESRAGPGNRAAKPENATAGPGRAGGVRSAPRSLGRPTSQCLQRVPSPAAADAH